MVCVVFAGMQTSSSEVVANMERRRALSQSDRKSYTDAVLCLQAASPRSLTSDVPGARSRFDDFVAVHIDQMLIIHYTVSKSSPSTVVVPQCVFHDPGNIADGSSSAC